MILGIDEVGRGAWAGPLVVGAVIMGNLKVAGLTDSKLLSSLQREKMSELIKASAHSFSLGWVHANELDQLGISEALKVASLRAIEGIDKIYSEIIVDGNFNFLAQTIYSDKVTVIKKADKLIPSVSAASIIAKVARDDFMRNQHKNHPRYGFESNVGYGTKLHQASIKTNGIIELHRKSFLPILNRGFTSKEIGNEAEKIAATYLKNLGHKIIKRNWKTKLCEIDIISIHENTIFFTEVKYRKNNFSGNGVDAITKKKMNQMQFAAEMFIKDFNNSQLNYSLAVASLSSNPIRLDCWLEVS